MMSKSAFIGPAIGVGLVAAFAASGGEAGGFGLAKAAAVAVFSGGIVYALGAALDSLNAAKSHGRLILDELGRHTLDLPALHEYELLVRSRGPSVGAASVAEAYATQFADLTQSARTYPAIAIQAGFCGTIVGIILASLGLHGGSATVATVVAWCGGSLICTVVGYASSAILGAQLSAFDSQIRTMKILAEGHARELLAHKAELGDDRLAQLISQAVAQSFAQSTEVWDGLRAASKEIQQGGVAIGQSVAQLLNAAERLGEQTEVANRIAWQMDTSSGNIVETAKNTAESSRLLQDVFVQFMPMFRGMQLGVENLNKSIASIYPALEAAQNLQMTIKAADLVFRNIDSQVAGMAASLNEQMKSAGDQMVLNQQRAITDGVGPALKTIAHTMDLLLLLIDRSEQLLRNLPLAVPAKRLVDDLNSAGVAHLAAADRDAKTVQEVSLRLETTEARMEAVLLELKSAHTQIAASLKELGTETAEISRQVEEVTAHIEGPFWKKLGGRKA
jgi:hypothetical protein